jgi:predicted permease
MRTEGWMNALRVKWRALFRRAAIERELDEELRYHVERKTEENVAKGMTPEEARRAARIALGGVEQVKERVRAVRAGAWLGTVAQDARLGLRMLRKNPGFTTVAVLTLALGIGANAAIFSLIDGLMFRPLPVPNANEIINIDMIASRLTKFGASSYLDYVDFCERSKSFRGLATYSPILVSMSAEMASANAKPEAVWGLVVSGNYFSTLGVEPAQGRFFRPDEDQVPGRNPVAVISYGLWKRSFGGNADVVGASEKVNGHSYTIIGVAPESFTGVEPSYRPDIYVPVMMGVDVFGSDRLFHDRSMRRFNMAGRLRPGVTVAQAQAEMEVISDALQERYPETNREREAIVRNYMARRMQNAGIALPAVLIGLVSLVLLVSCANVASLMIARATSKVKEVSIQLALGATPRRLIRKFMTESALVAAGGGALGILMAYGAIRGFAALVPHTVAAKGADFRMDTRVLGYAAIVSLASVFLFGLAPALLSTREASRSGLNIRTSGSESSPFSMAACRCLISGQVALSVVLLIAGGLLLKTFTRAQRFGLGFNPNQVLLVTLDTSLNNYSKDQAVNFYRELLRRTQEQPGVQSAAIAAIVPLDTAHSWDLSVDGYIAPNGAQVMDTLMNRVSPGYFANMQIPLLEGREFTEDEDRPDGENVAIVNETLARRFIVGKGSLDRAVGHVIRLTENLPIQIVGVVKDSTYDFSGSVGGDPVPVFYLPFSQHWQSQMTLQVRADGNMRDVQSRIQDEIRDLDPEITPIWTMTMADIVSGKGLYMPRMAAMLGGIFGSIALTLAVIGLYGVVSFLVQRRIHEIGVRMALGAQRGMILRMILVNGVALVGVGVAIGIGAALALTPLMTSLLIGVSAHDPMIFILPPLALFATTVLASWIPANRATHVDPLTALRSE